MRCLVTPDDGADSGSPVPSNPVSIENTPPVLAGVTLSPTTATETDTFTCTPGTTSDADGDAVTVTYAWTVDGSPVPPTAATLDGTWFDKGDVVTCTVTPTDGEDAGAPGLSNVGVVVNSGPVVSDVAIAPEDPTDADTLTCTDSDASSNSPPVLADVVVTPNPIATLDDTLECTPGATSDPDGDPVTVTIAWRVNGMAPPVPSISPLQFVNLERGDLITCEAVPFDGQVAGTPVVSNTVEIGNTPPAITALTLSPTSVSASGTFTCVAGTTFDEDGDAVTVQYSWTVNGSPVPPTTSTLDGTWFERGDSVRCITTPFDGFDTGVPISSPARPVVNAPPVVSNVQISPSFAMFGDTLGFTYDFFDADGDADQSTITWRVDGAFVGDDPTFTLGATRGQEVTVTVQASDGLGLGNTAVGSLIVENSPPENPAVSFSFPLFSGGFPLSCLVNTAAGEVDGDPVDVFITWEGDGQPYPAAFPSAAGPTTSSDPDDTIPGSDTGLASVWTCTAVACDATDCSASDSATVTNAGPTTEYGYSAGFGSGLSASSNFAIMQRVTIPTSAIVVQLGSIWINGTGGSIRMFLYADDGAGDPGDLVAFTPLVPHVTGRIEAPVTTPAPITPGDYYVGYVFGGGSGGATLDAVSGGTDGIWYDNHNHANPLLDPATGVSDDAGQQLSLYAIVQ